MGIKKKKHWGKALLLSVVFGFAIAGTTSAQQQNQTEKTYTLDLPEGPLDESLLSLGNELGINILATNNQLIGKTAPPIIGAFSAQGAIDTLLEGSGLIAVANEDGDFIVTQKVVETKEPAARQVQQANTTIEAAPLFVDTVIVTGQQIDRSLQDTKESVAVITAEDIELRSLIDIPDVLSQTANVTSNGGTRNVGIRGISRLPFSAGGTGDLSTTYYDDVAITNNAVQFISQNLWDVDQVEFLRGPQSTNFGRNALAGALVIRSKAPQVDGYRGAARLEAGNFDTLAVEGMVNLPVTENSALRLTAEHSQDRGFVDNVFTGANDDGRSEFSTLRGQYLVEPNDRFRAKVNLQYGKGEIGDNITLVFPGQTEDKFETQTNIQPKFLTPRPP
ncbi:MAG: TonB-dependent receptor, partial [Pseudomonadota bacterium]